MASYDQVNIKIINNIKDQNRLSKVYALFLEKLLFGLNGKICMFKFKTNGA